MRRHLKDYFIPHEGNDYKPHSLQRAAVAGMIVLVLLTFLGANLQAMLWISSEWLISTVLPAVVIEETNDERRDASLVTLRRNPLLDEAARMKAEHMAANEYFSHYSPSGVSPWFWFGEVNYNFVHAGENLAIHFTDSTEVVAAWMDSPTHRANILNSDYREIGVGTAAGTFDGFSTVYVVQLFGTPAAVEEPGEVSEPAVAGEQIALRTDAGTPEVPVEDVSEVTTSSEADSVLAESVALTETIETFEAPAEPVIVPEATMNEPSEPVISATEDTVVVYSDHLATSTGAVPAAIDASATEVDSSSNPHFLSVVATQPQFILQLLYAGISAFVIFALMLSIVIEIRRQHPVQIAYSVALLLLMYGLFTVHKLLSAGALVV